MEEPAPLSRSTGVLDCRDGSQISSPSPHRQRAFLWALEHMDLMEALAEKANGKPPPTDL